MFAVELWMKFGNLMKVEWTQTKYVSWMDVARGPWEAEAYLRKMSQAKHPMPAICQLSKHKHSFPVRQRED